MFLGEVDSCASTFGWRSLSGLSDPKTPVLSEVGCSHDCQTTSKLCQECYNIIERSRLISGSFCLFTRRVEWFKWVVSVQCSDFRTSRRSCQLCHVLWYSLDEQERLKLAGPYTAQRQLPDAYRWLWLSIRKEQSGRCYISLSDGDASRLEDRRNLCEALEIREEQLNGQSPSIHVPTWTGDCIELAKTWMTDCEVGHKSYCSKTVLKPSKSYLPTIPLYVGDKVSGELRLEETHSPGFDLLDFKYLALSYCRNENKLPMTQKLTLDKKDEWKS